MNAANDDVVGALDIGGSHVSAARVGLQSGSTEPWTAMRVPFGPDAGREELLGAIVGAAASVATGAGCSAWPRPGRSTTSTASAWSRGLAKLEGLYGVDLGRELGAALGGRTTVTFLNDAEAFLLGEAWAGAAAGHARAVGVTLGTGLGSAFLVDGRIVADDPSVPPEGSLHLAPFRGGPVEDVISARALRARHGAEVAELARRGDAAAFDELGVGPRRVPRTLARAPSVRPASSSAARSPTPGPCSARRSSARSRPCGGSSS